MTAAIRAEPLKPRTARLPRGLLALTVGLTSLERVLFDSNAGGTGHASIPSLATHSGQSQAINISGELLLLSTVIGIVIASSEFRHRTATGTYLATPNRVRVLGAKTVAAAGIGLLFGLSGATMANAIGLSFIEASGHHLLLSTTTIARYSADSTLACAFLATAGAALGTLVRSQIGAIIAIFVWGFVIEQSVGGIYGSAQRYLPYTAAGAIAGIKLGSEKTPLPFAAAALLAVSAVLITLAAARTTLQADIT